MSGEEIASLENAIRFKEVVVEGERSPGPQPQDVLIGLSLPTDLNSDDPLRRIFKNHSSSAKKRSLSETDTDG